MLSLKTDVISIRNTQLIRCYYILALQHCSLIKTGHQCSKWGLQGRQLLIYFVDKKFVVPTKSKPRSKVF